MGGLYAGGVMGMAKTAKKISADKCKRLVVITVGLSDPADEKNIENIRKAATRQIPNSLSDRTEFYHLRGGIDYEKLSFKHRMMMKMLYERNSITCELGEYSGNCRYTYWIRNLLWGQK